jgi:DNA topoisomerase-1
MSILVIVESPAKCKKIEHYLNQLNNHTYKCLASCGHIRELAGLDAIDIHNNFAPTFIECESKKKQISQLKKAAKDAQEVILASDDDREGEAIAWHLCEVLQLPVSTTKRIIFHEITETALTRAIQNPTYVNMSVVQAQLARQVLDLLVGYKISPFLWKHVQDGLSAGRCQTPALRLIYDNQKEIDANPGKQKYVVTGYFTKLNIPFVLSGDWTDSTDVRTFLNESLTFTHTHKAFKTRTASRSAPHPFTTSTLQQAASNELNLSPKETMQICQALYEEGYITYHRTDRKQYSEEFKKSMKAYIRKTYATSAADPSASIADPSAADPDPNPETEAGAHEAIRPTDIYCLSLPDENSSQPRVYQRLYQLIWRRTVESCLPAATVSIINVTITAPRDYEYSFTTEQSIFLGWKIVGGKEKPNKEYTYLQAMSLIPAQSVSYSKIKAVVHFHEKKAHYTEARLVQLLEEEGIGRPSTFSSLAEKIQERKYVKKCNVKGQIVQCTDMEISSDLPRQIISIKTDREFGSEKNKLVIQPVGILALEFLLHYFDTFFNYSYTKQMEDDLDLVAQGEKIWYEVCRACYTEMTNLSSMILEKGKETIRIDAEHTYMVGKYGPVVKRFTSGQTTFLNAKTDIDLNKLRRGEYIFTDVIESRTVTAMPLGEYEDKPVYIKVGKFGNYLEWNSITKSLRHLKKKTPAEITWADVEDLLPALAKPEAGILRLIDESASIRQSKHGHYIYYKNDRMKKPRFLKLAGFKGDYLNGDISLLQEWFRTTYLS